MGVIGYTKARVDELIAAVNTAIGTKVNSSTYSSGIAAAKDRTNHIGTQLAATISDLGAAVAAAPEVKAASGSFFWVPGEVVKAGDVRMTALGINIRRNADGTTGSSYDATEAAKWTAVASGSTVVDATTTTKGIARLATTTEAVTGTADDRVLTPAAGAVAFPKRKGTAPAGSLRAVDVAAFAPRLEALPGPLSGGATVRVGDNLTSVSSLYWPNTFRPTGIASPRNVFYKLLSTDHDTGAGGFVLMSAPALAGPWTDHGKVYTDGVLGTQTETPHVIYVPDDPDGKPWYVYYSNSGTGTAGGTGVQSTILAKTATFESGSWTRVGIVMQAPAFIERIGDGHTGYARVWRDGSTFHAITLQGGNAYPQYALWNSLDGIKWVIDRRMLSTWPEATADPANLKVGIPQPFLWRGQWWAAAPISANGSSGVGYTSTTGLVRLSEDGRLPVGPVYTYADIGGPTALFTIDGEVYMENSGAGGVAGSLTLFKLSDTGVAPAAIASPRAVLRAPDGRPARVGLVRTEKTFDFLAASALPAGLEFQAVAGSGAVSFGTSPVPTCTITTGATNNNDARLRLTQDVDVTDLSAIWFTVEGMAGGTGGSVSIGMWLSATADNAGLKLVQNSTDAFALVALIGGVGGTVPLPYKFRGANGSGGANTILPRRKNVTFLWQPRRELAYVMEDDQVYGVASTTGAALGAVRPLLFLQTKAGSAQALTFEQVKVGWER